jgi:hypothetical protein
MQSWLSWLTTGLLLALAMFAALLLIGLARLAPNFIRWIARSALAAALLCFVFKMVAHRVRTSSSNQPLH